jgi:hypothetical protein
VHIALTFDARHQRAHFVGHEMVDPDHDPATAEPPL